MFDAVDNAVESDFWSVWFSGEAEFIDDQPALPDELYGHYVLSTIANAKIDSIDASKALVRLALMYSYTDTCCRRLNDEMTVGNTLDTDINIGG